MQSRQHFLWRCSSTLFAISACATLCAAQTAEQKSKPATPNKQTTGHAADTSAHKKYPANRLAKESSPYLLLHAHNPVDWYPWGDEAFARAKKENKPVFLSIGYSSCYWCHVMERKVFSDPKIAAYMNKHFINVKVDREERPDVDDIYMTSLTIYFQAIGSRQGGGWPLSMFLTPEKKPFAGGTYFPPDDDHGRMGFNGVSTRVNDLWTNQEQRIRSTANMLTDEVKRIMKPQFDPNPLKLDKSQIDKIATAIKNSYDKEYGGIGFNPAQPNAPKFPTASKLSVLSYVADHHQDGLALEMLNNTLDHVARGGIRDHLAGGFHRYSTDRRWHVPHFEKMLYDQSQLAMLYTSAWQRSKSDQFKSAATTILDYVLRDFTNEQGGFYSALDAETDAIEGKYYVWSEKEVRDVLGSDAELFMLAYGMKAPNDFEHGYVLHQPKPFVQLAKERGISLGELENQLRPLREKVLLARGKRKTPLRDDKVVTSWNGLMISAYAQAADTFERDDYKAAAEKAAGFLLDELKNNDGRLLRTWRKGDARLTAYLDDYAFVVSGLLELHRVTKNTRWLDAAKALTDTQIKHFWSETGRGFFFTADDHEELIARTRNAYDNVLPSGNSVSVRNLLRLAKLTKEPKYQTYARQTLEVFMPVARRAPSSLTNMAVALGEYLSGPWSVDAARLTTPFHEHTKTIADTHDTTSHSNRADFNPYQLNSESVSSTTTYAQATFQTPPTGSQTKAAIKPATKPADKKKKPKHVKARAYLSVDKLPAGKQVRMVLVVDIEKGWHINANPSNPDFLEATKLAIKSKYGTKLAKIKYPKPKKTKVDGFDEPFHIYEGKVIIHGLLEIPPNANVKTEEFQITLDYQACNDNRCLKPTKVTLAGKVPIARQGERVKLINAALFPDLHRKTSRN